MTATINLPEGARLGVSPLSWTNDVLEDLGGDIAVETCLAEAAEAGYTGIELGRKFPREAGTLGPLLDRFGLALASGWHSGFLADRDVEAELAAVAPHAELLRALGATVMVYGECGRMPLEAPLDAPMSGRLLLDDGKITVYAARLTAFSRELKARYGLTVAYHHHLMMVAETFDEIAAVFDAAGPELGLLLDTGHAFAAGFDYARLIARFGGRIVHIHLKDVRQAMLEQVRGHDLSFNDAVRRGLFTVPGDGCVDFGPLLGFVGQGYRGWLIVEAEQDPAVANPKDAVTRAYRHLSGALSAR